MANIHLLLTEADFFRACAQAFQGSLPLRKERLNKLLRMSRQEHRHFWRSR